MIKQEAPPVRVAGPAPGQTVLSLPDECGQLALRNMRLIRKIGPSI
jgi:hypothetical protein